MLEINHAQQRVFIVGDGSLFDEGITRLLARDTALQVSHLVYSDKLAFLHIISNNQPDLILFCEAGTLNTDQLIADLSSTTLMLGLCIFVIHSSNLTVDAYERSGSPAEKQPFQRHSTVASTSHELLSILKRKPARR